MFDAITEPVVTYVLEGYPPEPVGGAQFQAHRVASRLTDEFNMRVLTGPTYDHPLREDLDGVSVRRVSFSSAPGKLPAARNAAGIVLAGLNEPRPAIVQGFQLNPMAMAAAALAELRRARLVIKITHRYNFESAACSLRRRRQVDLLVRAASAIVVPSLSCREVAEAYGVSETKLQYIPNGVDSDYFCPADSACRATARRNLGYGSDDVVFLWIGRLDPFKNLSALSEVWGTVQDARPQARLLLVADGEEESVAQELSSRFPQTVQRLHLLQNVLPCYHAADVLVLTTQAEGLSNTLLEALACGLTGVVSDAPENVEVGAQANFLRLYDRSSPQDLACALVQEVDARASAPQRGVDARARVVHAYSLLQTTRRWASLYRGLLPVERREAACGRV